MRSVLIKTISLCSLILLSSCGTLTGKNEGVSGKATRAEEKAHNQIELVNDAIVYNDRQKLQTIGVFATGTEYALSKIQTPDNEIDVARELNSRVLTLTESPSLDQLKKVHSMVDNLVSSLQQQRDVGLKELAKRDGDIYDIQLEKKSLSNIKDQEIKRYMDVAQSAASKADQYEATLGEMDSMWGIGAIFFGVKRLFTRAFIFLSIFAFIYLVLRVLSTMHPAGAAAFQIFDMIASVFMNIIKGLAPGAAKMAKLVPEATSVIYKQTLGHMVGTIETLKQKDSDAATSGQPVKKYSLTEILNEFSKVMDRPNKDVVDEVKTDIRWNNKPQS